MMNYDHNKRPSLFFVIEESFCPGIQPDFYYCIFTLFFDALEKSPKMVVEFLAWISGQKLKTQNYFNQEGRVFLCSRAPGVYITLENIQHMGIEFICNTRVYNIPHTLSVSCFGQVVRPLLLLKSVHFEPLMRSNISFLNAGSHLRFRLFFLVVRRSDGKRTDHGSIPASTALLSLHKLWFMDTVS